MKGYEFTKRGLAIIVILVIALIALPISVISVRALSGSPDDDHPGIYTPTPEPGDEPGNEPDGESGNGSGEGSGNGSEEEPGNEPGEEPGNEPDSEPGNGPGEGSGNGPEEEPGNEPEPGPIDINVDAGIMSFMFSPEMQDSIDTETVSMMGDFLKSPENTRASRIVARIPNLDESDSVIVIDAIAGAFAQYGVSQNRLSYVIYPAGTGDNVFEISFSFERVTNPK